MIGYDKPLYVLPVDHQATFSKNTFVWQEPLDPEQKAEIAAAKRVIFDAFKAAAADRLSRDRGGILLDEPFGADILRDARNQGFITACPAETRGQDEFDFKYGPSFASQIELFNPTFCKVLVRYNPGSDKGMNKKVRQWLAPPPGFPGSSDSRSADYLLGPACELPSPRNQLRSRGCADRRVVPRVGGPVREGK
jgi:myo-inositol catabolism protein IolC